jgi:hypothetical protein
MTHVYSVLMSDFLVASVSPPPVDSAPPSPDDANTSRQHANAPSDGSATDTVFRSASTPSTEISGSSSLSNPTFLSNIFPNLTIRGSSNLSRDGESRLVPPCNLLTHLRAIHRLCHYTLKLSPDVTHTPHVVVVSIQEWS